MYTSFFKYIIDSLLTSVTFVIITVLSEFFRNFRGREIILVLENYHEEFFFFSYFDDLQKSKFYFLNFLNELTILFLFFLYDY